MNYRIFFNFLSFLGSVFIFLSCGDGSVQDSKVTVVEEVVDPAEDWIGVWRIKTIDGEDWEQNLMNSMLVEIEQAMVEVRKAGIDPEIEINVSGQYEFSSGGIWNLVIKMETTILGEKEVSEENGRGTYNVTQSQYSILPEGEEKESGSWKISGSLLKISSSDGTTLVLERV